MQRLRIIDSHTAGEPTRAVIDGFPAKPPGLSLADWRERLRADYDHYRRAAVCEPRGNDILVGAWIGPPAQPGSAASVVFFNNVGYLGMCGHGTIGVIATLQHLRRIGPGTHGIDTPVGTVQCRLHDDGRVTVRNVPSYRWRADVAVHVPGLGEVRGDVAWGGNWFFLAESPRTPVAPAHVEALTDDAWRIRAALRAAGHTGAGGAEIDHIELLGPGSGSADGRSFVLCPGKAYDRSPCGTGTSAKLACLAAAGQLAPGQPWRQQSVIGSEFEARYELASDAAPAPRGPLHVIPLITGRAFVCAEAELLLDPRDPFCWGIG
jgi:4-hydroxyproline epimerase